MSSDFDIYELFLEPTTPWPCLSFDFINDKNNEENLNKYKENFDITCVAGSQAANIEENEIYILKFLNLNLKNNETKSDSDSDSESETDSETESELESELESDLESGLESVSDIEKNIDTTKNYDLYNQKNNKLNQFNSKKNKKNNNLRSKSLHFPYGTVNKIKVNKKVPSLFSAWCSDSNVYIYDISEEVQNINTNIINQKINKKYIYKFQNHTSEGFSMDWNTNHMGILLTGDNHGNIYLWLPHEDYKWVHQHFDFKNKVDNNNRINQKYTIEDIQWANDRLSSTLFAFSSSDGSIRFIDIRDYQNCINPIYNPNQKDINVISWNYYYQYMIASAGDDHQLYIYDIRMTNYILANINIHQDSISSISWNFFDSNILLLSSYDHSISFWDLSMESESLNHSFYTNNFNIPDQLLFQHKKQKFITEAKFSTFYPGIILSTSYNNFNLFKLSNI